MGENNAAPLHDLRPKFGQPGVQAFLARVAGAAHDGPLPAALTWIQQHAHCGSTLSLPDELARAVCFTTEPGADSSPPELEPDNGHQAKRRRRLGDTLLAELPASMAALPFVPPPRPRLSALEPIGSAAVLHALRLNVRLLSALLVVRGMDT
jgi:hypothetical protein